NPNGIDLSGSAYSGSVLNTGDSQSLNGHFGQYDEPIVLAIRAGGNLNFGSCTGNCVTSSTSGTPPVLGSLSDGFTQNPASGPLYGLDSEVAGPARPARRRCLIRQLPEPTAAFPAGSERSPRATSDRGPPSQR